MATLLTPQWFGLVARLTLIGGLCLLVLLRVLAIPPFWVALLAGVALAHQAYDRWFFLRYRRFPDNFNMLMDLGLLVALLRLSGGTSSPLIVFFYVWLYSVVLASRRRGIQRPFEASLLVTLVGVGVGGWGFPNFVGFVGVNLLALVFFWLETQILHGERRDNDHDPLTGVYNRRRGLALLAGWVKREPFCLAFVDLTEFKAVNDRYGHLIGDEVLRAVAQRIAYQVRKDDLVIRYGGDEFVIASHSSDLKERLQQVFLEAFHTTVGMVEVRGDVGCVESQPSSTLEQLLVISDNAMYKMKYTRGHEPPDSPEPVDQHLCP
jgi:diguanylate cyclase (GGDEF)-like protein